MENKKNKINEQSTINEKKDVINEEELDKVTGGNDPETNSSYKWSTEAGILGSYFFPVDSNGEEDSANPTENDSESQATASSTSAAISSTKLARGK